MKGVVAKLVRLQDPATTTALEVAAGGKLYQVLLVLLHQLCVGFATPYPKFRSVPKQTSISEMHTLWLACLQAVCLLCHLALR